MMLPQVTNFLKRNKKVMYYLGFFAVMYFALGDSVFAEEDTTLQSTISFFDGLLKGVGAILALLTYLVTLFLDPSWINGSIFGLTEKFRTIWIMISNIVYFIFAILLVWIAFMNIIGKEGDKYQLKQALPKFVVGVLIVPFSWFIVQLILSFSSILTVSAISLPYDTFEDFKTRVNEIQIKNDCVLNLTALGFDDNKGADSNAETDSKTESKLLDCKDGQTTSLGSLMEGGGSANRSIFAIISTYTYGIMSLETLSNLSEGELFSGVKTILDVVLKVIIDVLFVIIYAILMIALGLVLMIRGIYLWLYIMFSPLFGLMYFFDKNGSGEGFFEKFNLKEFFALAMVPVYTMLALSFGLLFMYVVGQGLYSGNDSMLLTDNKEGESSLVMGKEGDNASFKLTIKGSVGGSSESIAKQATSLWSGAKDLGNGTMGVVGTLIMQLFGIVVLWGTIMAAMRSSSITKAIVEPIHQFGTQVGSIIAKAPQNIPVFGGQSMKSMGNIAQKVGGHIDSKSLDRANDFVSKNMSFLDPNTMNGITRAGQISNNLKSINNIGPELAKEWRNFLGTVGSVEKGGSIEAYQNGLKEFARIAKVPEEELKNLNTATGYFEAVKAIESKMDSMNYGALKGTVAENSGMKREDVSAGMKELGTNPVSPNIDPNAPGNVKRGDTIDKGLNGYAEYVFNINGHSIQGFTGEKSGGYVEGFRSGDYRHIAEHIKKNVNNREQLSELFSKLEINDDKIIKAVEKELTTYFKKDGSFVSIKATEGDRIGSIDDLFKKDDKSE